MATHFSGLMTVFRLLLSLPTPPAASPLTGDTTGGSSGGGGGGGGHSVPPDLVRRGLSVLEASHRAGGLFRLPPFAATWLQPLLTDALRGLAEGAHPLTQEEVHRLVFDLAEVGESAVVWWRGSRHRTRSCCCLLGIMCLRFLCVVQACFLRDPKSTIQQSVCMWG